MSILELLQQNIFVKYGVLFKINKIDIVLDIIRNLPDTIHCNIEKFDSRYIVTYVKNNPLESMSYCGFSENQAIENLITALSKSKTDLISDISTEIYNLGFWKS